jgi:hypothetical protein
VTDALLVSIDVTPKNVTIAATTQVQYQAIGTYTNGSTVNLTHGGVTWTSSDTTKGTITSADGLATAVATGATTITATSGTIFGSTTLNVNSVTISDITVTPPSPNIALGLKQQFKAVATFSDGSIQDITLTAVWTSGTPATATVSATGLANSSPGSVGTTVISAAQGGVTGSTTLTVHTADLVNIVISPSSAQVAKGNTTQFKATGVYTDNSQQDLSNSAAWDTGDHAIATISSGVGGGLASTFAVGTVAVTAKYQGLTGNATLQVTAAILKTINVSPVDATIAKGTQQPYQAQGIFTDGTNQDLTSSVSWSSDTPTVATVSAAGVADGKAQGVAIIRAQAQGITSNDATLHVTPETLVSIAISPAGPIDLPNGLTQQFKADGTFTDGSHQDITSQVAWLSSDGTVAVFNADLQPDSGLAKGTALGATNVTATLSTTTSNTVVLNVTNAVLQTITVSPATQSLAKGLDFPYLAMGHYSDGQDIDITNQVTWKSSSTGNVTIDPSTGLAHAVAQGTSNITASQLTIVSNTAVMTVTDATLVSISLSPTGPCIANATTQQFIATGHYTDTSTVDLTNVASWDSSNQAAATIVTGGVNSGIATAKTVSGTQQTNITAQFGGKISPPDVLFVGVCPPPPRSNR